ncbi:MAG: VWA domain-containing protein [Brucellaceae bacterium]|nr:VWA domain-containing protein [Brucellaceae bacterium]
MILASAAIPMLLGIGLAVDFTLATDSKTQLQGASDSAVMAAAALALQGANEKAQQEALQTYFKGNCEATVCNLITNSKVEITADKVRMEIVADTPMPILKDLGVSAFPVKAISEVNLKKTTDKYIDVYFMIDISGSMNIADGEAQIKKLQSIYKPYDNPDGCAFACHSSADGTYNGKTGFEIAKANGVYLRENRIRDEMSDLAKTILTTPSMNARIGIRTFQWSDVKLFDPKHQNGQVQNEIANLEFSSGGTSIEFALNQLASNLPDSGAGETQSDPKVVVVLVTDGMTQNPATAAYEPLNSAVCDKVKNKDISLFVFNIEYPKFSLLKHENGPSVLASKHMEGKMEAPLMACASKGRYYKGDFGTSVADAFDEILEGLKKETEDVVLHFVR